MKITLGEPEFFSLFSAWVIQDWNAPLSAALGDLGFDYSYIMAATADRVPCVFIENGQVANYDPSAPIEVSYVKNFPGEPTGKIVRWHRRVIPFCFYSGNVRAGSGERVCHWWQST